jgi:hypothetical protein
VLTNARRDLYRILADGETEGQAGGDGQAGGEADGPAEGDQGDGNVDKDA